MIINMIGQEILHLRSGVQLSERLAFLGPKMFKCYSCVMVRTGFRRALNFAPIRPKGISLSDNRWKFIQSGNTMQEHFIRIYMYIFIYICIHMYIYSHIYVFIYIYTFYSRLKLDEILIKSLFELIN